MTEETLSFEFEPDARPKELRGINMEYLQSVYRDWRPARPTIVFATYWYFAVARQNIFFKRLSGETQPWTDDAILARYRFTNAYRASDRVSQYLIRHVIYRQDEPDRPAEDMFFRILLFKIFNKVETWQFLEQELGEIALANYSFERYDRLLTDAMERGCRIFSGAYIMPSGSSTFGFPRKHSNYLKLLEHMLEDRVPSRLKTAKRLQTAFEILRRYPLMGDFLAYQYTIDLNYSAMLNFSENEFIVPGPGARDGIRKCFESLGGLSEAEIIMRMTASQDAEFERLGLEFRSLGGRPLQLIDCQNIFCEVGKYARVAHPDVSDISGRTRIKQNYSIRPGLPTYWYPPKWGINEVVATAVKANQERNGSHKHEL